MAWGIRAHPGLCCCCGNGARRGNGWFQPDAWHAVSGYLPKIDLADPMHEPLPEPPAEPSARERDVHAAYSASRDVIRSPADPDSVSFSTILWAWLPLCGARAPAVSPSLPLVSEGLDPHERAELVDAVTAELAVEQARRASALVAFDLRCRDIPQPTLGEIEEAARLEAAHVVAAASAAIRSARIADAEKAVAARLALRQGRRRATERIRALKTRERRAQKLSREQQAKEKEEAAQAERERLALEAAGAARAMREAQAEARAKRAQDRVREQELMQARRRAATDYTAQEYREDQTLAIVDGMSDMIAAMQKDQARREA